MLQGSAEGAAVGFVGGLLLDSVGYTPFGINAALLGILGYCAGLPEANVYRGNLPFFLGTAALVTLVYHSLVFVLLQALGLALPPFIQTYAAAVPAAMLNALLLAPTFLLCRRLLRMMSGWTELRL
jgi:rod shape-determining protein MreD